MVGPPDDGGDVIPEAESIPQAYEVWLRKEVAQQEIDLFAKYFHPDMAVADGEFYLKRAELNLLKELLRGLR